MAFDSSTRNRLAGFVKDARDLVTREFTQKFKELYGISENGQITPLEKLLHLDEMGRATAVLLRERIEYLARSQPQEKKGLAEAVGRLVREQAFTVVNRLAAIRMAEKRGLIPLSVGKGYQSDGFRMYDMVAGKGLGEVYQRYRRYLFCLFDELALEIGVLFQRHSPQGLLFPREKALLDLIELLNASDLDSLWAEDETIGWIYQYYNDPLERKKMRDESSAPRNSRELAVRNQFFTPRYVVEFLTDNTLGRIWYEMTHGETKLKEQCRYLVRRPNEIFLKPGETAPEQCKQDNLSQEDLLKQPVHIPHRPFKDPRTILMLDPACGSMHFGLYAFDLLEVIYDEAWTLEEKLGTDALSRPPGTKSLHETYTGKDAFFRDVPRLIIENNLHGIDIDPRCAQIAGLSLWLRAQKAWQRLGLKPAERPAIKRSNIVCAEPMPGDKELLRQFVDNEFSAAERPVCLRLLEAIFDKMQLAGEAGSLLKIEEEIRSTIEDAKKQWKAGPKMEQSQLFGGEKLKQQDIPLDYSGLTESEFWDQLEGKIYAALRDYAEQAEIGGGFQRRLFAEDAARGFAFIDVCRKRYDVVVMNPPFGEAASLSREYIEVQFGDSFYDLYAVFVERGTSLLGPGGKLGAITNRTGFYLTHLRRWRRKIVTDDFALHLFVDLGAGVLDAALVETASYIINHRLSGNVPSPATFFRCTGVMLKDELLNDTIVNVGNGIIPAACFVRMLADFAAVPGSPLCYWIDSELLASFRKLPPFTSGSEREAWMGLSTGNDYQWLRLWWEVRADSIAVNRRETKLAKTWAALAKGGEYAPFWSDIHLVVNWAGDGQRLSDWKTSELQLGRITANNSKCWNQAKYFRRGLTWSRRTTSPLSVRILPEGTIFGDKGPGLFCRRPEIAIGVFHTSLYRCLVELQLAAAESAARSYEVGLLGQSPFPEDTALIESKLQQPTEQAIRMARELIRLAPCSREFLRPWLASGKGSISQGLESAQKKLVEIDAQYKLLIRSLDAKTALLFGTEGAHKTEIIQPSHWDSSASLAPSLALTDLFEYLTGVAFGRWDVRYATGERQPAELPDPFDPLPVLPPGMLQNAEGLPAKPKDVLAAYPVRIPWDGLLVDDTNHPLDIERHVRGVIEIIWSGKEGGPTAEAIEHEACEILGVKSLRDYFRKPAGFFADHLKRYSKSRRQAPIYWPLSTASGSYTIWIYYHRLTDQTLHSAIADFLDPKIKATGKAIDEARSKKRGAEVSELSDLLDELNQFREEIERVIKLPWKPNLNDGVLITACPLWRLFRHGKWYKDLKACWEALSEGEYDWAHLAYSIWPDRVRDKCKADRSLAIAHNLEELCKPQDTLKKPKKTKKQ